MSSNSTRWFAVLTKALVAVGLIVVANVVVYRTSPYFEMERRYHSQMAQLKDHTAAQVLVVGDSHIAHAGNALLNADAKGPAFSLAFGGDSMRESFGKLEYAVEQFPNVDTLIVSADLHMFGRVRQASANRSFANRYFLLANDSSGLERSWLATVVDQVPIFNDDFLQYLRKAASNKFGRKAGEQQAGGADVAWVDLSDQERSMRARTLGLSDHEGVGQYRASFYWYERIFQLARRRGLTVVAIRMPAHTGYWYQTSVPATQVIDEFVRETGAVKLIDMRALTGDPRDFDDPDHVNTRGALKFIERIEAELGRPLLSDSARRSVQ